MTRFLLFTALFLFTLNLNAQVTLIPTFVTQDDSVTIRFDATQGNGALAGIVPVYMHTGVITSQSTSPTDWQRVQGNWGTHDPNVLMQYLGNSIHEKKIHISSFYTDDNGMPIPSTEIVEQLAFVFRNGDGSTVGRAADGSDIFVPLYQGGFSVLINSPNSQPYIVDAGDSVEFSIETSDTSVIRMYHEDSLLLSDTADRAFVKFEATTFGVGQFWLKYEADYQGTTYSDSVSYTVNGPEISQPAPSGIEDGPNIISPDSVIFQFFAPGKNDVYLIGDFNDWQITSDHKFFRDSNDPDRFWIAIGGLNGNEEYGFQYYIHSDQMRVPDVYVNKILDPNNDPWIPEHIYPNLKPYPVGKTTGIVSVIQTESTPFNWQYDNVPLPSRDKMVIYELLVRDFVHDHSYQSIMDTLNYLQNLGVNVIEFMPVNEFEGNISWGYNPSFHMALDKYYGTAEAFKTLIDECHRRGIGVVLDAVYNHSFGQNPQVQMYFDPGAGPWGQPTPDSPWFNEIPRHDFNVGYDYNHESPHTRAFFKRVIEHWLEEYHIDGFRFDLSKGFTQNNTLGDVGAWGQYDQSRIDILNDYAQTAWNVNPNAWIILEHFAENNEERALSDDGMMLWGNENYQFNEATMGYPSNLSGISYQNRGWSDPNLIGFYCSHDEERLMFKNLEYGNSSGNYDVRDFETAMHRMEAASAFMLLVPGPKMVWQFDEVGYDFSINTCEDLTINNSCRISPKPIRWDYAEDTIRTRHYQVFRALSKLKTKYDLFSTESFGGSLSTYSKRLKLNSDTMNAVLIANFSVVNQNSQPNFQHTGMWYDYFTGDSLDVVDSTIQFDLNPGDYHLFIDRKLPTPDLGAPIDFDEVTSISAWSKDASPVNLELFPNPANDQLHVVFTANEPETCRILVYDLQGRMVLNALESRALSGANYTTLDLEDLPHSGVFVLEIQVGQQLDRKLFVKE